MLLDHINYLQFSSLFSSAGHKEIACGKICISTKQIENSLNHWSIYLFILKNRHFNPINGKLYYLVWRLTWKKYLKHAVNYDTKWHIIFMLLLCSLNDFSFTNCEPHTDWSLETDSKTDSRHACHARFSQWVINATRPRHHVFLYCPNFAHKGGKSSTEVLSFSVSIPANVWEVHTDAAKLEVCKPILCRMAASLRGWEDVSTKWKAFLKASWDIQLNRVFQILVWIPTQSRIKYKCAEYLVRSQVVVTKR